MELVNASQLQMSRRGIERAAEIAGAPALQKTPVRPETSVHVTISDEARALQMMEEYAASEKPNYIEKTDAEYKTMSFKELVDERDANLLGGRAPGDDSLKIINGGKVASAVIDRILEQKFANAEAANALNERLGSFADQVKQRNPNISRSDFDIMMVDGKPSIVSTSLSKADLDELQRTLEDPKNKEGKALLKAVQDFNESSFKLVNMLIYDEQYKFGDTNAEGNRIVHRSEPVSMEELTRNISYQAAGREEGGTYTTRLHQELVGSTGWGAIMVYENN